MNLDFARRDAEATRKRTRRALVASLVAHAFIMLYLVVVAGKSDGPPTITEVTWLDPKDLEPAPAPAKPAPEPPKPKSPTPQPAPVTPGQIDAVLLTHAHLDHSGYLPLLARDGYTRAIHTTPATRAGDVKGHE